MKTSLRAFMTVSAGVLLLAASANATTIPIPSTTVLGTATFPGQAGVSTAGPTITLTSAVAPTDTLSIEARGQVFLQGGGTTYGTNAAGVVTTAGSTGVGGVSVNGALPDTDFGALLLGNAALGFHQLFPAEAFGLGSATPPSVLGLPGATLASLGFGSTLPSGTTLQFMVSDTLTSDNGGSFTVSGHFDTAAASVPEPATLSLLALGGALSISLRLRARRR